MGVYLGIDTSNYTTSVALYDAGKNEMRQSRKLLPVKDGDLGLRQSDAVFHHTRQLPERFRELFLTPESIDGIGVSVRPRNSEGSYMPCFLSGKAVGEGISAVTGVPLFESSHQVGHILAALYSGGCMFLRDEAFIAFHVSGGTTDCLLCKPSEENIIDISEVGTSLDLKAGQLIDRVGLKLGLSFPCGKELDRLSQKSEKRFRTKAVIKDGSCCLSGVENQCSTMLSNGEKPEDTAKFCLFAVLAAIKGMELSATEKFGGLPVLYAGGVMSNTFLRSELTGDNKYFALPEFSCDNAAGMAVFAALKSGK